MVATPEKRVKQKLRELLKEYPELYQFWPVQAGYGATTLDVLGCYRGRFFAVETKATGREPTTRQEDTIEDIEESMGRVFIIVGMDSPVFDELRSWLDYLGDTIPYAPHFTPKKVGRATI